MAKKALPSPTVATLSVALVNSARPSIWEAFKSDASTYDRSAGTTNTSPVSSRSARSPSTGTQHVPFTTAVSLIFCGGGNLSAHVPPAFKVPILTQRALANVRTSVRGSPSTATRRRRCLARSRLPFDWRVGTTRGATRWRSRGKDSHEARVSEEVLSVGRDPSISRAWSDRAGQLHLAGDLQHHDDGLAHDVRLLTSIVRLLHLGGEPQLSDVAALEGVRDQSSDAR